MAKDPGMKSLQIKLICLLLGLMVPAVCLFAQVDMPCVGTATTVLNVRSGPGTGYSRIGQLSKGEKLVVKKRADNDWLQVEYNGRVAYVHSDYITLSQYPAKYSHVKHRQSLSVGRIIWKIFLWGIAAYFGLVLLYWLFRILVVVGVVAYRILTVLSKVISFPFFLLNALQRYLAKPWFVFFKDHHFDSKTNQILRIAFSVLKVPFYIVLTPVRLVNAVYFNLVMHCLFEMFNYIMEVVSPSDYREGDDSWGRWILFLPWRILKYVVWHGTLTVVESLIWTVVDVFLPALTLYHGTSPSAANSIVSSPERAGYMGYDVGIWRVGGGNYAGNGIYFAPVRSTAKHYSSGSLIICRVTLGPTLDLGLAPYHVFSACGHPDATEATSWGLENGYVTGEWWRPDERWWEYCMYDWQNRYNYSWRIRPLYVLDLNSGNIQRIPGGMCHWLFRKMVIEDIWASIE